VIIPLAVAGVIFGLAGTTASAYIYLVGARPSWNMWHTPVDFLLSSLLLGSALVPAIEPVIDVISHFSIRHELPLHEAGSGTDMRLLLAVSILWAINQAVRIVRLRRSANFEQRASYNLLRGDLLWSKVALSGLSLCGAVVFTIAPLPVLSLACSLAAVALSRYLFFVSVVPLSMGLTFLSPKSSMQKVTL
jgi:formate dehydrogenase iron-sulfur subunit